MPFDWDGNYRCFYCKKQFTAYEDLRKHTKSHDRPMRDKKLRETAEQVINIDVSVLTCEMCERTFKNVELIIKHLIKVHKLKLKSEKLIQQMSKFQLIDNTCVVCQVKFEQVSQLIEHVNSHKILNFRCYACGQVFGSTNELDAHVPTCDTLFTKPKEEEHFCSLCWTNFPTALVFKRHLKFCLKTESVAVHEDKEKRENLNAVRESICNLLNMTNVIPFKFFMQRFRCFYCKEDYTDFEPLKHHTQNVHSIDKCDPKCKFMKMLKRNNLVIKIDITSLTCKLCSEPMNDVETMLAHLKVNHNAVFDETMIGYIQPFKLSKGDMSCLYCSETFRYFAKLLEHINDAHANKKIVCSFCGMSFGRDSNYRSHFKRHHLPDSYKCDDCEAVCGSWSKLSYHRAKVHGEKTYKCPKCTETFGTQYKRQRHLIVAHGSGHACSYCGKLFTRNSFMKDHIRRSHLKERNTECSVCKERFFDNCQLRIHMVKHIGERNFHCDICGKTFLWKKNLRGHMSSHK